jgi:hypothetical protein
MAKILVVTDGAYGYRIKGTVNSFGKKNKFIGIYKIDRPDDLIVDDIEFPKELIEKIKEADILLLYTQHPDNTYYLCYEARKLNKDMAIIVATWSGEGEKKELKKFDAICPEEMCLLDEKEVGNLINKYPKLKEFLEEFGTPKAKVYVKFPCNIKDFLNQRRRTFGGYYQIRKIYGSNWRSISQEISDVHLQEYIKNPIHLLWLTELFFWRLLAWVLAFWDVQFKKKKLLQMWSIIPSTK